MGWFHFLKGRHPKRLGLALGGGGARGLAHIAFLKVLDEAGIRPAVISGTSIGALIGALYAAGHNGLGIERILREMNWLDIAALVDVSFWRSEGFIKGEKIAQVLGKLTENKRIEELAIPLRIVAADYWKEEEVVFQSGPLVEAVRASISLPGIFEPVVMNGRVLVDGGIVNSLPYEMIRKECDLLVAVNVIGDRVPGDAGQKPKMFEAIFSAFQIMEGHHVESQLKQSRPDLYLKPSLKNIEILAFDKLDEILASAEQEAALFKNFLLKHVKPAPGQASAWEAAR